MSVIHYIPIITTLFAIYFLVVLFKHWQNNKAALHIFWWMLGVLFYGAGTVTESINTLFGFSEANFRAWYILGALLGGAPLAQGTAYLLAKRKLAHILAVLLVTVVLITTCLVLLTPLNSALIENNRMTGKIIEWTFIRYITPFINLYAFLFLVGGAVYSAIYYARKKEMKNRFYGNVLIAIGGLLPGIGGSFTKFGYIEVLYVTELIGLLFIYFGYIIIRKDKATLARYNQAVN